MITITSDYNQSEFKHYKERRIGKYEEEVSR